MSKLDDKKFRVLFDLCKVKGLNNVFNHRKIKKLSYYKPFARIPYVKVFNFGLFYFNLGLNSSVGSLGSRIRPPLLL